MRYNLVTNIQSPTTYLLPWVRQVDHLGHIIHESGSQDVDCRKAKGSYIRSITAYSLQNDFGSNILNIYDEFSLDILNSPAKEPSLKNVGRSPFKKEIISNVSSIFCYSSGIVKKTTSEL